MLQQNTEVDGVKIVKEGSKSYLHVLFFFTLAPCFKVGLAALQSFGTEAAVRRCSSK